jgi:hypothetical protein
MSVGLYAIGFTVMISGLIYGESLLVYAHAATTRRQ